ncbi:DUF3168 domain-containing protein [Paracoccus litorisediminis]|jgi:hypothetical protein|uniref:DUF3168 domain-containing protein n=1 Tax=Paracoccus litorisediminis TaxID=2006130 RepID=A0A844HII9_9RHOB|nr:DUF3168 domain-containing protein [Paracoccus litorisediminis]MTH58035.1 DUF3168 domain-containing protein [Paracoccus litorisediminis]
MSFAASVALQAAVYRALRQHEGLGLLVGDAIYDALPVEAPSGTHVALGQDDVRDAGDATGAGSAHDFTVSVLSGAGAGFSGVKMAAAAVTDALEGAALALGRGHLVGLWFLRSRAKRTENGAGRRVDLTFRARIDLG